MLQSLTKSAPITVPAKTLRPRSLFLNPVSVELSPPPAAVGTLPPMSKVKRLSPLPRRMKATMRQTRMTAKTAMMMITGFMSVHLRGSCAILSTALFGGHAHAQRMRRALGVAPGKG